MAFRLGQFSWGQVSLNRSVKALHFVRFGGLAFPVLRTFRWVVPLQVSEVSQAKLFKPR